MVVKQNLDLELVCIGLPRVAPPGMSELRLGVQAGRDVRQDVPMPVEEVIFRCPIYVAQDPRSGGLDFSGEYVHGPRGERFMYLCWGDWVEGQWQGNRRAKLKLNAIEPGLVEAAVQAGRPLRAVIHMSDAKGQPVAASLKPGVYEWTL